MSFWTGSCSIHRSGLISIFPISLAYALFQYIYTRRFILKIAFDVMGKERLLSKVEVTTV